ncbi:hypothetical protein JCM33374_g1009 [Metschnikowia sp. JCM 33374]|nr:hypothetical protein JCM33374_g1009 [Metschnikowia sp. JCM 33374]
MMIGFLLLSFLIMATHAIAKDTTLSLSSRYNSTEEPPKSCIFDKIVIKKAADFSAIGHCESVRGNIEVTEFAESILRFDHLSKIEGSLTIKDSDQLTRVDAYSLRVITETFKMEKLQSLGLVETPNLATVKTLDWQILPLLSQAALDNLKDVQSITISDTSLETVAGFAGDKLYDLDINNNRFMESIQFDVEEVSNMLQITGNANNVEVNLGNLEKARNMSVSNVRDLNVTNLNKVEGSMTVVENTFTKVSFPALTRIDGSFRMADNNAAKEAVLGAVVEIGGGVSIVNNTALENISFFSSLQSIGGALELKGDIHESEWKSLKMVKGSISLQSTNSAFDCGKWTDGPIRDTLRGGEIECTVSRSEGPRSTSASGSSSGQKTEHSSESTKKSICEWLMATLVLVFSLVI